MQVGQRVVVIGNSRSTKKGATGFIVEICEDNDRDTVGVFLLTSISKGHDLGGSVPEGHGRWFAPSQLLVLQD